MQSGVDGSGTLWVRGVRERNCNTGFGYRCRSHWGSGVLPAPYAEGDIVRLVGEVSPGLAVRLGGQVGPLFTVTYCPSIDAGDAWYARVWDGVSEFGSDRLHVAFEGRCSWDPEMCCDWMRPFALVETSDPDGFAERARVLAESGPFVPCVCPGCTAPAAVIPDG